jgi:glycosyltransferase involved in cell wall biosynthesis
LVKYNDEFNLIEAIKGMHKTPEIREEFIVEGRKTIQKYSMEKMIKQTFELLKS